MPRHYWDSSDYSRLVSLHWRDGMLLVGFANGDEVAVSGDALLPESARRPVDWGNARLDPDVPFHFLVGSAGGDVEIPALRVRVLTDPTFAAYWNSRMLPPANPVGQRLRQLRQGRHLTSQSVAKRAGVTARSLSRIELGQHDVTATTLDRLLRAMDCSWKDLETSPQEHQPTSL